MMPMPSEGRRIINVPGHRIIAIPAVIEQHPGHKDNSAFRFYFLLFQVIRGSRKALLSAIERGQPWVRQYTVIHLPHPLAARVHCPLPFYSIYLMLLHAKTAPTTANRHPEAKSP